MHVRRKLNDKVNTVEERLHCLMLWTNTANNIFNLTDVGFTLSPICICKEVNKTNPMRFYQLQF